MNESVLLLAPSQGLGGGIERYAGTIEAALIHQSVPYRRLDLLRPGIPGGTRRKIGFVWEAWRAVQAGSGAIRLVLAHRNLLPVVHAVARHPNFAAATVVLHGSEIWSGRRVKGARMMRRPDVRVLAASNFSAGALARTCHAAVLHPGVSADWYQTLVEAGKRRDTNEIRLVTAFRLPSWRTKGLQTLLQAVRMLDDGRVRLTVCGSGPVPSDLVAVMASYPWCRLAPDLTDRELAEQLADADLFVLGTRTRTRTGTSASGEGFGLALLEAQLAGTPVVAPAHGGSNDAFLYGITGLAPVDETPESLATVLASLVEDDARRAEMARAAAAWSRVVFEPDAHSRRTVEAIFGRTLVR